MLNYEQIQHINPDEFIEKFRFFGPFAWSLDYILKLTPLSPDNIWTPQEEIHSSVDNYFLYRAVYLNPDFLKHYKEAYLKNSFYKGLKHDPKELKEAKQFLKDLIDQNDILY